MTSFEVCPGGSLARCVWVRKLRLRRKRRPTPRLNPNGTVQGLGIAQNRRHPQGGKPLISSSAIPVVRQFGTSTCRVGMTITLLGLRQTPFTPKAGFKFTAESTNWPSRGTFSKGLPSALRLSAEERFQLRGRLQLPSIRRVHSANFCASAQHHVLLALCLGSVVGRQTRTIQPEKSGQLHLRCDLLSPIKQFSAFDRLLRDQEEERDRAAQWAGRPWAPIWPAPPLPAGLSVTPDVCRPGFPRTPWRVRRC